MRRRRAQIAFSQRAMDEMIALAWQAYPAEAVGLIGAAPKGTVTKIHGLRNLAPDRAFFAHPWDQYQAIGEIEIAGDRLIATFHSHPEGGAQLSEEDRKYVFEVASTAIVIALNGGTQSAHVAAFARDETGIENVIDIVIR